MSPVLGWASALYGAAWEARRRLYAAGLRTPHRVAARVVSVGNLTAGGTGKTTLTLHLARKLLARGPEVAVVCRRYRPGPGGIGDEEAMYRAALGDPVVYAGPHKRTLAERAAASGARTILVDDGFSHWALERDLDLVLLDARDLWGGERLLPAGRLREPRRALQRAEVVVVTRLDPGEDPEPLLASARRYAPAAILGAGRHRVTGLRPLAAGTGAPGSAATPGGGEAAVPTRVWIATATGAPRAVERSACEYGLDVAGLSAYRDHHWFRPEEVRRERERAAAAGAALLLTGKDAVRWPPSQAEGVWVLAVEWEWVSGGERIEAMIEDTTEGSR